MRYSVCRRGIEKIDGGTVPDKKLSERSKSCKEGARAVPRLFGMTPRSPFEGSCRAVTPPAAEAGWRLGMVVSVIAKQPTPYHVYDDGTTRGNPDCGRAGEPPPSQG